MIPDIPQIRDSLAALRIIEAAPVVGNDRQLTICEKRGRIHPDRTVAEDESAIVLTQNQSAPMILPRLIDRIAEEMCKQGHAHSMPKTEFRDSLAAKFTGMSVAIQHLFPNPLEALNLLFKHISQARVIQWAVINYSSTRSEEYRFGDFQYGVIDVNLLRSRCERAGSDFFDLHWQQIQGKRALARDNREITILEANHINFPGALEPATHKVIYRLVDEYYGDIAEGEKRLFLSDLDRQQAIYGAAGLGTIPGNFLLRISALTQWITVFTRQQKGHGWVLPNQTVFKITSYEPKALADGYIEVTKHLKLQDWLKRPLDPWIQTFCHYIAAARDYDGDGRIEEALLHLVFGLDLLLGGESGEALTTVLAERVAFLSHLAVMRPLKEVATFVRECYDLRSGYVHRGGKGTLGEAKGSMGLRERFDRLALVARAILGAACFARLQAWCQEAEARYAWIKRIDVLRAKNDAGLGVDTADLDGLGLTQVRIQEGKLPSVSIE